MESAKFQENYCPVSDGKLFFLKAGTGPPLVFIHGFGLDHRMWESQINYFSGSYTCISIDLRGFGKSSLPTEKSYSHHEDLNTLLAFLRINQKVILVGLSMGARVVANFALTYPEKTRAIIFADGVVDGFTFKDFDLANIYEAAKDLGVPVANRMWLDHPIFEPTRNNAVVVQKLTEMLMSYSGWHWTNKNPVRTLTPAAIEQLEKLTMPTLILIGQLDIPDFQELAHLLNTRIKHSSKIEIPGAGHMCNMEMPEKFNDLVNQFLNPTRDPASN